MTCAWPKIISYRLSLEPFIYSWCVFLSIHLLFLICTCLCPDAQNYRRSDTHLDSFKIDSILHIIVCDIPNRPRPVQHTSTRTASYFALVYSPRPFIISGLPASLLLAVRRFNYNPNASTCSNMAISLTPRSSKSTVSTIRLGLSPNSPLRYFRIHVLDQLPSV